MATKREQIVQAIKDLMISLPGVPNSDVYRSRVTAFSRDKLPSVVVEWVSDDPANVVIPMIDWTLRVRISVITRGDVPDQIADPIIQSIHEKINVDLSLGGLCLDILPAPVQNNILEADKPAGVITLDYLVRYRTTELDLSN